MMENELEKLKQEYQNLETPSYLIYNGWVDLKFKLGPQKSLFAFYFARPLIFASIALVATTATITTSLAAKPGSLLYPVKIATENLKAKITGNYNQKIENRGQEIIDLSRQEDHKVDQAIKNYVEAVDESKVKAHEKGSEQEFKKTLENQEQKFKNAQNANPNAQENLQKAIQKTEEAKGQVEGAKDNSQNKNPNSDNGNSQNRGSNNSQKQENNSNHSRSKNRD